MTFLDSDDRITDLFLQQGGELLRKAAGLRFDETVAFGEDRLFNYRYLTLLAEEMDTLTAFALFWFPAYGPVTRKESLALQEQTNEHPKR